MLMLQLALRNLARNRRRTILTSLSMVGGFLLLSLALSIANGSYDNIIGLFTSDQSGHVQLNAPGYQAHPTLYNTLNNPRELLESLDAQPQVRAAAPRVQAGALAYGGDRALPAEVWGVDLEREVQTSLLGSKIKAGVLPAPQPDADGYYQALIGRTLAERLDLGVGDEIVLIGQGADGSLANDIYLISGIVGTKDSAEQMRVILPLAAAQDFLMLHNRVHSIVVQTDSFKRSEKNAATLQLTLDADQQQLTVSPWQVVEKEFFATMEADKEGNKITIIIVVVLVGLGVLNTVLMSTLERTGEFGLLKAIGTSPGRLFALIQLETFFMALGSCLLGLLIALPINYYFATTGIQLPEPVEVAGIAMSAMKGSFDVMNFVTPVLVILISAQVVSLLPAWRSARIVPLTALRSL